MNNPWKIASNWTAQDEANLSEKRKLTAERHEAWEATHPQVADNEESEDEDQ